MNELTFAAEPIGGDSLMRCVVPSIDGASLAELIRAHARTAGPWVRRRAVGAVGSLDGFEVTPSGSPLVETLLAGAPAVAVLGCGCGCGEIGCGASRADIRIDDGLVTWENFSPPAAPRRVSRDLGPFVFESRAYRAAVEGLRAW